MGKNQHVVRVVGGKGWGVKGEGNTKYTSVHSTQREAIAAGRTIAQNQKRELIIHGIDGKIRDSDSFGNDPCPPRDRVH